jgi:hypothetical protein
MSDAVSKSIDVLVDMIADENQSLAERENAASIVSQIVDMNAVEQLLPGECCFQCGYEHDGPWCVGQD